jgi:hypothetical protein
MHACDTKSYLMLLWEGEDGYIFKLGSFGSTKYWKAQTLVLVCSSRLEESIPVKKWQNESMKKTY